MEKFFTLTAHRCPGHHRTVRVFMGSTFVHLPIAEIMINSFSHQLLSSKRFKTARALVRFNTACADFIHASGVDIVVIATVSRIIAFSISSFIGF